MSEKNASLIIGNDTYELPIYEAAVGPDVIDIGALYKNTDMFTFDPGFTSTASCESAITYIDGDQGVLLHRGYPIDELAEQGDFLETCYLLLYGFIATVEQKAKFDAQVTRHTMLHDQMTKTVHGFSTRRASHGNYGWCRRRTIRILPRFHRHRRSTATHDRFTA